MICSRNYPVTKTDLFQIAQVNSCCFLHTSDPFDLVIEGVGNMDGKGRTEYVLRIGFKAMMKANASTTGMGSPQRPMR